MAQRKGGFQGKRRKPDRRRKAILKARARKLQRMFRSECERWNARIEFMSMPESFPATSLYHPEIVAIILSDKFTPHQALRALERQFLRLDEAYGTPERAQASYERGKQVMDDLLIWHNGGPKPEWLKARRPKDDQPQGDHPAA